MPDAIEWRAVERRVLRPRRAAPVRHAARPAALQAAVAARARADGRRGARAPALRGRPRAVRADHGARVDRAADGPPGVGGGLGPAAARQVRRARRRHRDGLAVEQAAAAPLGAGRGRRARSGSATRATRGSRCSPRSSARSRRAGGRVLTDRPAARVARDGRRLRASRGRAGLVPRGHDPRAFAARRAPSATTAWSPPCPNDVFEQLLDPALAAEVGEAYLARARGIEYFAALCLLLELDRRFRPYYWTNVADRELPFVGLIEHTNFVEPERYGGRRFLYVANYLPHGHELLGLDADALLARYEPGLRAVNPAFSRDWVRRAWLLRRAGRAADRHRRLRATASRRCARPAPGLVLANTTQVYPEDRGTNYAVRLGTRQPRPSSPPGARTRAGSRGPRRRRGSLRGARACPGTASSASSPGELELDVAVELLEALLAGELGPGGAEQPRQQHGRHRCRGHRSRSRRSRPARRERGAELAPGIVDGLVERAARGAEALGEDVDRDALERDARRGRSRWCGVRSCAIARRTAASSSRGLGALAAARRSAPASASQPSGVERDLAPLPGAPPHASPPASSSANLYAHVVKRLSPRKSPSLARTATSASSALWWARSS